MSNEQQRLLKPIVDFCRTVADNQKETQMTPTNLGTCIGPNFESENATPTQLMNIRQLNEAFAGLVTHAASLKWDKLG